MAEVSKMQSIYSRESCLGEKLMIEAPGPAESMATLLLSNILETLERLEQHLQKQNIHLSNAVSMATLTTRETTPDSPLWDEYRPQALSLRASIQSVQRSDSPLTPPDSVTGSPADPYSKVISELKSRFSFSDLSEEEEPSHFPVGKLQSKQKNHISLFDENNEDIDPASVTENANGYDSSIYSTQLLASQLALAMAELVPQEDMNAATAETSGSTDVRSFELVPVTTLESAVSTTVRNGRARRVEGLRRSISRRTSRVGSWTKTRISHDVGSVRVLSVKSMNKAQLVVRWISEETRSRVTLVLTAPGRFWNKMTVTRVFYP
jgi:hypothetical protein